MPSVYGGQIQPAVVTASKSTNYTGNQFAGGGIGSVFGGVVGGIANMMQNAAQRRWSENQAKLAYDRQVAQWRRENAYNTPAAMVARLRAAGINVNDAFSGQGAQPAAGLSSVGAAEFSPFGLAGAASSMIGASTGIRNSLVSELGVRSSVERNRYLNYQTQADISRIKAVVQNTALDSRYKSVLLKYLDASEQIRLTRDIADIRLTETQQRFVNEQINFYGELIKSEVAYNYASARRQDKEIENLDVMMREAEQRISESLVRQGLTQKQADWYAAQAITSMISDVVGAGANSVMSGASLFRSLR